MSTSLFSRTLGMAFKSGDEDAPELASTDAPRRGVSARTVSSPQEYTSNRSSSKNRSLSECVSKTTSLQKSEDAVRTVQSWKTSYSKLSAAGKAKWKRMTTALGEPVDSPIEEEEGDATATWTTYDVARKRKSATRCQLFLNSTAFDLLIGSAIVTNSVCIALDQTYRLEGVESPALKLAEHIFLCIYSMEITLRFVAFGWSCLRDNWVKFDVFLVLSGVITTWILEPHSVEAPGAGQVSRILVLRSVRLLRLARMVRLLAKFKELWMLVQGILNCAYTMFYTLWLLAIILFIFASIGFELITENSLAKGPETDEEFARIVEQYFSSLPQTMLTLIQFVCLDSVGPIWKPLVEKDPYLTVYFVMVILIVPVVLMNLVTAVIVNGAIEQASKDKEANRIREERHKKMLLAKLEAVFRRLDEDNSGTISREELANVSDEDIKVICSSSNDVTDPLQIFDALDVDGEGCLGINEFCEGIWQLSVSKSSLEVQRMLRQVNSLLVRNKNAASQHDLVMLTLHKVMHDQRHTRKALEGAGVVVGEREVAKKAVNFRHSFVSRISRHKINGHEDREEGKTWEVCDPPSTNGLHVLNGSALQDPYVGEEDLSGFAGRFGDSPLPPDAGDGVEPLLSPCLLDPGFGCPEVRSGGNAFDADHDPSGLSPQPLRPEDGPVAIPILPTVFGTRSAFELQRDAGLKTFGGSAENTESAESAHL